jgi:hypothetical protein
MNNLPTIGGGKREPCYRDSPSPASHRTVADSNDRVVELEIENARLNRLVAELLIKNQQLRRPD